MPGGGETVDDRKKSMGTKTAAILTKYQSLKRPMVNKNQIIQIPHHLTLNPHHPIKFTIPILEIILPLIGAIILQVQIFIKIIRTDDHKTK